MAVAAKDIPITRDVVYGWLQEYKKLDDPPRLDYFIARKVNELNLPDPMVQTHAHESLNEQTSVVEMILADLPSYG